MSRRTTPALLALTALLLAAGCSKKERTDATPPQSAAAVASTTKAAVPTPAVESGDVWVEQVTRSKKPMKPIDLAAGGLAGFTIKAPEGAIVGKAPAGKAIQISESGYGYQIWLTEDPKASVAAFKAKVGSGIKKAEIAKEDERGIIVSETGFDKRAAYYYRGVVKAGDKTFTCQTVTSIAPGSIAHAEATGKACASLTKT